jgi:hypothetical protein
MEYLKTSQGPRTCDGHTVAIRLYPPPAKNISAHGALKVSLVRKKCGVRLSQCVASKILKGSVDYGAGEIHPGCGQELGAQENIPYLLITVMPATIPDVLHVTAFKHAFNNDPGMTLVVELFNIRVPKNAIIKKWFVNAHGSQ